MANTSILAAFERMWQHVIAALANKSDKGHAHDNLYYTESEIDSKMSSVNTSISNITSGSTTVAKAKEAEHAADATHATSADNATSATSAASATKATKDGFGNTITSTYETKTDATSKLNSAKSYTDALRDEYEAHVDNDDIHFTAAERTKLSGIADNANKYSHPNSGVTAGTYKSVTVNAQGHVTGGSNPTTLAGYGITDAATATALSSHTSSHAPANAEKNTIVGIQKNGTDLTIDSSTRKVNITVPTKASDVGADAAGTATSVVSTHNTSTSAHGDIRDLISGLTTRLNALADSDDTTLDQMSEVVAYIKSNKDLIDSITTSKVNVSDIINNLTTNVTNKPLSSAQGVALKGLIDALESELGSHGHAIADVSGLQSALDGKAASSHGTHVSFDSTNKPKMDGTAAFGTSSKVARADHVHPTDTSRAAQSSLDSHTGNSDIHVTSAQKTNWNAAKTHADSAHAPSNAQANQNAFSNIAVSGQTTVAADTTTDTVTFAGSNVTITTDATNDKVTFSVADGTTSAKGVVKLTNSTSSTSTTTAATPSSVKSAYDLANTAKTNAATAQSKADSAYTLAEGKVSTNQGTANAGKILKINSSGNVVAEKEAENGTMTLRHDAANKTVVFENVSVENLATAGLNHLGITATAEELNYMDGVTSNVQTQLNEKVESLSDLGITASASRLNKTAAYFRNDDKTITDIETAGAVYVTSLDDSKTMPIVASEFQTSSGHKLSSKLNSSDLYRGVFNSGNLDELRTKGIYWLQVLAAVTGTKPVPDGNFGFLEIIGDGAGVGNCIQRWTQYNTGNMYVRSYVNNAWSEWATPSGGNSDGDFLPLSGGTLTGQLNVSGGDGSINLVSTNEGGNLQIYSPSSVGGYWEMDAYNGNLRVYRNNGGNVEQHNSFPNSSGTLLNSSDVGDASSATAIPSNSGLVPTVRGIYYGLPTINGSHSYTSNTNIYAPTSVGTKGHVLVSNGSGAPSWKDIGSVGISTGSISSSYTNTLTIYKRSGIVTISGSVTLGAATRYNIGTIASGYRPKSTVFTTSVTNPLDSDYWRPGGPVTIEPSGTVYVIAGSDHSQIYFTVTYVAA